MDFGKWRANSWYQTPGRDAKNEGKISLASRLRFGRRSDHWGCLVAKLHCPRADDVFFCSVSVSGARHRSSSKWPHCCSGCVSGFRSEKCALYLRAGFARRKKPRRYGGRHISVLVGERAIACLLRRWKTKEAGRIGWASADALRCPFGPGRYLEQGRTNCFHSRCPVGRRPLSSLRFGRNTRADQQTGSQSWRAKPSLATIFA